MYILKKSIYCKELGLKQKGDKVELDEELAKRLENFVVKIEDKDDLDTLSDDEIRKLAKEKGIKGNITIMHIDTLKAKLRE